MIRPTISIVVPVFNNESSLEELTRRIVDHLSENSLTFEIIYINDSSEDASLEVIKRLSHQYPYVRYIHLSSNAGQHWAIIKGLEKVNGEKIVVMDADLQDQPELIAKMNALCTLNGHAVFILRNGIYQSPGRMFTSRLIKIVVQLITGLHYKAGSYFMIHHFALHHVLSLAEKCPYPYISIIAASCSSHLSYLRATRLKSIGSSGYTFWKRIKAAYRAIICAFYCSRFHMVLRRSGSLDSKI